MALVLTGSTLLGACGGSDHQTSSEQQGKTKPRVEVVELDTSPFTAQIRLTGQTEAEKSVTVAAETAGRILKTWYEEGKWVKKGQRLARMEGQIDRTRVSQLEQALEQARRDRDRVKHLHDKGLAPDADLERAKLAYDNARFALDVAREGFKKKVVRAPLSGVVDRVFLDEGEFAAPGAPLVTIIDYRTIVVRAGLPESGLPYAERGKSVRVELPSLQLVVDARIRRVGVQADTRTRTFPLEVEVDNADLKIRPGMRADVLLPTLHVDEGLLVPRPSVIETLAGRKVFVVRNGRAKAVPVTLGPGRGVYVLVQSGLKKGDHVVVVGHRLLADGEAVKVVSATTCCVLEEDGSDDLKPEAPGMAMPTPSASSSEVTAP